MSYADKNFKEKYRSKKQRADCETVEVRKVCVEDSEGKSKTRYGETSGSKRVRQG